MTELYSEEELAAEAAKIRSYYPSLPAETCERFAKEALTNKHKQAQQ